MVMAGTFLPKGWQAREAAQVPTSAAGGRAVKSTQRPHAIGRCCLEETGEKDMTREHFLVEEPSKLGPRGEPLSHLHRGRESGWSIQKAGPGAVWGQQDSSVHAVWMICRYLGRCGSYALLSLSGRDKAHISARNTSWFLSMTEKPDIKTEEKNNHHQKRSQTLCLPQNDPCLH